MIPQVPAVVMGETRHHRLVPFSHRIKVRSYLWLIDVDSIPRSILAKWSPRDHFGGNAASLREAVETFASAHDANVQPDDRILMLAAPKSFGYVFNPLSVYYCVNAHNEIRFAILEIHNTYGERHAHLLYPNEKGDAGVEKEFYVSPFFEVRGRYEVKLRLDSEKILSVVNLFQDEKLVFSATFTGKPLPADLGHRIRATLRTPLSNFQTTARIRMHGIYLWARRLPVVKRPVHSNPKGML